MQFQVLNGNKLAKSTQNKAIGDYKLYLDEYFDTDHPGFDGVLRLQNAERGDIYSPELIEYFADNGIRIVDIECGANPNLALDDEGRVYSWGTNDNGECGQGPDEDTIYEPRLIKEVKDYIVTDVGCGFSHSYLKTDCDKHYMFGSNSDGECCSYNDERNVFVPYRVDEIIKDKCKATDVIKIVPAYYNTKVIVTIESS